MIRVLGWFLKLAGGLAILAVLAGTVAVLLTGRMIGQEDEPGPADAIVVLGGGLYRPLHAADLYRRGLAPMVCVSRILHTNKSALLAEVGVDMPEQHELYRRLLVSRGVPAEAVRLYGQDLASTRDEARALDEAFPGLERVLVVTSPYHAPRARLIFHRALPRAEVRVTSTPYESFPARWWSSRDSAVRVVNETAKLIWYIVGGCFDDEAVLPDKATREAAPATPRPGT